MRKSQHFAWILHIILALQVSDLVCVSLDGAVALKWTEKKEELQCLTFPLLSLGNEFSKREGENCFFLKLERLVVDGNYIVV